MTAENRFQLTKALFLEGACAASRDSCRKVVRLAVLAMLGVWLVMLAVTLAAGQSPWLALGEGPIILLVAVWLEVVLPRSRAKRAYRRLEARYGGDMERITRFYAEELEVLTGENRRVIAYSQIRTVLRSKNLLILVCQDKTGILVKLDGFTQGSAGEVQALIRAAASGR